MTAFEGEARGEDRVPDLKSKLRGNMLPAWIVLLLSLASTIAVWRMANTHLEERTHHDFMMRAGEVSQRLNGRFEAYTQVLQSAVALFKASDFVSRKDWRDFIASLKIDKSYPAMQAVAFARHVDGKHLETRLREIRHEVPDFALRPAGERDAYVFNLYAEPFVGLNTKALGFDMWQDPIRRQAMAQAIATGTPAITEKITLKVDEATQPVPAFIMYLPVMNVAGESLYGFVLSPFRIPSLVDDLHTPATRGVTLALYDGPEATPDKLLHREPFSEAHHVPRYTHREVITLAGRQWTLETASDAHFGEDSFMHHSPELILSTGGLISLLLFALIGSAINTRQRAEQLAREMTLHLRASEARFRELFQQAPLGVWLLNPNGSVLDCNQTFADYAGAPRDRIIGFNMLTDARDKALIPALQQAIEGNHTVLETPYTSTTGNRSAFYRYHFAPIQIDGRPELILSFCEDITEQRGAEQRHSSIIEASMDGFVLVDLTGRILECNEALCELTGFSRTALIGKDIPDLDANEHPEDTAAHIRHIITNGRNRFESRWRRQDSSLFDVEITATFLGLTQELCAFIRDITLAKEHERELDRIAHYDTLTGVPNRTLLADRMSQAVARTLRDGTLMAICYLDLDGFKPINDRFGHEAGDRLLVEIADRLKGCLRGSDTVARMGGDEFVLLLLGIQGTEECEAALQRILEAVALPVQIGEHEVTVSASLGVALYPRDDADIDTLLRHADQSMYLAKQSGKNRFHIFDPDRDRIARDRAERLARIAEAIENHEFVLYYQPQVDMRAGRVIGAEVLIRWQHPERGLLSPAEFLSVIEDTDLIVALGDWIIDAALRQISAWQVAGLDVRLSVNIAARHLLRSDFVEKLTAHLHAHADVSPAKLELEIVETAALDDIQLVSKTIHACRHLGVDFALDDFGTGYSSLTYLKALPAQLLKIDQTFVRDMLTDKEDCAIVEGVIGLARVFHRHVIAEGVETIDHGCMLLKLGCDLAQGYGIARPMPAASLPEWIVQWRPDPVWQAIETVAPFHD